ncbi:MAG: T9SS type A sorting domain-containing protein [Candidatus Cloacimonetes bacterium]|nr:T9SS type A sorting domain-containing protein [Candidatus Cloacimonadota bacterium]
MKTKRILSIILIMFLFSIVCADPPNWEQIQGTQYSMVLMAQITFYSELFEGVGNNMAGAFGPGGETDCRSVGFWEEAIPPHWDGYWYFTIVGDVNGQEISFKIYDDSTDVIYNCFETIIFENNTTIGSAYDPFQISTLIGTIEGLVTLIEGTGNIEEVEVTTGNATVNPDEDGDYIITISPGIYNVTASLNSYVDSTVVGVEVFADQVTSDIDFVLYYDMGISLSLPLDASGFPGSIVYIPLNLNNLYSIGIEGIEVVINFDETLLDATGATLTGGVLENEDYGIYVNTTINGEITVWIFSIGDLFTGNGIISYLEFDVDSTAIHGQITELMFTQAEVNESPITTNNGLFTVSAEFDISGNISYFSNDEPVPNVTLNLNENNRFITNTDGNGDYIFTDIPFGNYTSTPLKENDLGGLSSMDASRIARFGVGLYDFNCYEIITADVTLNGYVSPMDASRVARYGVGLIDSLNGDGLNWVFVADSIESCSNWPPIVYESTKEYSPLNSDLYDEDFIGIRLGDVTGNWSPASLLRSENSSKTITAFLPDTTVNQAVAISIPLTVNDLMDLEGMDVVITFDENVIDATGATLTGGILENENFGFHINTNVDDKITLWIYALENPFTGSGVVCYLEYDVVGNITDSTALIFTQFDVNEISYLDYVTNGSVTIEDSIGTDHLINLQLEYKLNNNFPNPFNPDNPRFNRGGTYISYSLPKSCNVKIQIYNVKGQLVETLVDEDKPAGIHYLIWKAKDMSSGIYFYKIQTDKFSDIKKCLIMK